MKKILFLLILASFSFIIKSQSEYKFCELVGYQKIFSYKCVVAVDSGQDRQWFKDFIIRESDTLETPAQYKNEKFYVSVDTKLYEGKEVQSDSKGKYIWKKVEVTKPGTEIRTKRQSFNSMVDGMNFMGTQGWEFQQAFVLSSGNQYVYHWILKKKLK